MLTKVMEDTRLLLASMLKLPFSQKLDHGSYTELQCFALQTSDDDCKTNHANECPRDASSRRSRLLKRRSAPFYEAAVRP